MRMQLCAVGKLRSGPERSLTDDYMQRFNRIGRPLGLGPLTEHEVEPRKGGGIAAGAGLLARVVPEAAVIVALDERCHRPNWRSISRNGAMAGGRTWPLSLAGQTA